MLKAFASKACLHHRQCLDDLLNAEAQREFFIDLKVRPYAAKGGLVQPREVDADNEVLTGNMQWMRDKWSELMVKFYGREPSQSPSPQQPPGMDDVVAEMRQRLKVCSCSVFRLLLPGASVARV